MHRSFKQIPPIVVIRKNPNKNEIHPTDYLILSLSLVNFGQEAVNPEEPKSIPEPMISETRQSVTIEGQTINLVARAGSALRAGQ